MFAYKRGLIKLLYLLKVKIWFT